MSAPILVNDDAPEITFTKNGTWQTVDLATLLNHDDPKAVMILASDTVDAGAPIAGCRPVGSSLGDARTQARI